ncbi:HNH endonuclease signature motif containing protein [Spiroplasma endosymbiont of Nebria brevicollis]|uniref:HNH endonuclease signature motif containing protein n=1 Tax=Spiroplasma endosymbiont of Nebria brevicollis TaxID=3066284 RepID=UPI00313A899F
MIRRKKWEKHEKEKIWNNYTKKMNSSFKGLSEFWTLNVQAPCPWCCLPMIKGAYQGEQPTSAFVWNIDHIDGNSSNNNWQNLQPMHVECNIKKD